MAESHDEQVDREFKELLEEVRVVLPGVQLLGGFLLTIVFAPRFKELTSTERGIFLAAFISSMVCTVLLLAPSAHHRIRWRESDKDAVLKMAGKTLLGATFALTVAVLASAYLIVEFIYSDAASALVTGALAVLIATAWYLIPLARRRSRGASGQPSSTHGDAAGTDS